MALPTLDDEWFSLTGPSGAAEKIRRFNAAGTTIDELRGAGVPQSDIDWMLANDYSPPTQREPERVSRLATEESAPYQEGIDVTSLAQNLGIPSWLVRDLVNAGYSANDIRGMYSYQPEPPSEPATVYVGGQALPPNWSSFSSGQKINWYNQNNIKPSDLEAAGVSKADINWMRSNGYGVLDESERQEAERQRLAVEAARQEAARIAEENESRQKAASVGVELPPNWFQLGTQDKVNWLVGAKVSEEQLRGYGTPRSDIEAIKQYGYYDVRAKEEADRLAAEAFKSRSETGIGALYQEILGRAPTPSELSQYASQFGDVISPEERASFSTSYQKEIADREFAQKADAFRERVASDNPDAKTLDNRVIMEAINNKWSPEETLSLVNKAFGVNKTMDDYESAMKGFFQNKVTNLLSNGATIEDLKAIAAEQGIRPDVADVIISQTVNELKAEDIRNQTKGFINTTTADGKTTSTLDVGKLINWADTNNLSYTDVANALKTTFPSLTTDNLVFEKDRSIFVGLIDPKTNQVDFPKAISTAIDRGIELDNLAKFYGKTEAEFKNLVQSNLGVIANSLRTQGINPEAGLNDLLGLKEADTTAALKSFDQDVSIRSSLTNKQKDGLTLNEILDEVGTSGMSIGDFVNKYFGKDQSDLVTSLTNESKFTPEQRDLREDYGKFTSQFTKENPLTYEDIADFITTNKLTDQQAVSALGIPSEDLANYRTDVRLTGELRQANADKKLTLNEILDVVDGSNMTIDDFVKRYFGKDKGDLVTSLKAEEKFTPQERQWREAASGLTNLTPQQVVDFQAEAKLSDADMDRIFGIKSTDLNTYRLQTALPKYAGEDKQLSYSEIIDFANDNNISLSKAVDLIGTKETQAELLSKVEAYSQASPTERLADQLRGYIDPNSSGGAWTTKSGKSSGAGFGTEGMLQQIATRLIERTGIQDLNDLGQRTVNVTTNAPVYAFGTDQGNVLKVVTGVNANGDTEFRDLSADETQKLNFGTDYEGNLIYTLPITNQVQQTYNKKTGEEVTVDLGGWGQGPGVTYASLNFDASGKPVISTFGEDSTNGFIKMLAQAGPVLNILNVVTGGALTPITMAVNAVNAIASKNPLAIAASVAGIGGYTGLIDAATASMVQTGVNVANAVQQGNILGAITTIAGSTVGTDIGKIDLGDGFTMLDALNTASAIDRLAQGDYAGALTAAGALTRSSELQTAGSALRLVKAIESGNMNAVANAAQGLYTGVNQLVNESQVGNLLVNSANIGAIDADRVDYNIGMPVDLGAFNESVQVTPALGNATLGQTGLDAMSFLEANNIYNLGQGQYASVGPGTMYSLSDIYGYGDGTMADVRPYGDASVAELMAGFTRPTIGTGDARIAEIMASVNRPNQYQMDLVGAEYGTPYSVDWDNIQKTITKTSYKLSDSQGNSFDIPAGATLVKNARGDITGYNSKGMTYEYVDGKMIPRIDVSGVGITQETPTTVTQNITNFGSRVMDAVTNTIREMESSDSKAVLDVANTLKTNINLLGELFKGTATTVSSPAELFATLYNGNPNNPISEWASNLKQGISAAQAAADPKWAETKQAIEKQLTAIGADKGQIAQAMATVDAYANNPRMLAERIVATVPSLIPGVAAFKGAQMLGASTGAAYVIGAGAASTVAQSDLKDMANATYTSIRNTLKAQNPSLSSEELDIKAAAGTAMSMRQAGALSLGTAFSLQMLPIPNIGKLNAVVANVARETTQEVLEEPAMKVLSNVWQGKPLNADLGRTAVEAIFTTGPIAAATSALGADPSKTSKNVMWELLDAAPSTQLQLLTNQQNQIVTNSKGQPILIEYRIGPGLQLTGPSNLPVTPSESYTSDSVQSVFDVILNNESKFGYTVNGVSLDGQTFSLTGADGKPITLSSNDLLNNALNVVTQQDPTAARTTVNGADIASRLAVNIAQGIDLNGVAGDLSSGTVLASNDRGVFITTPSGDLMFAPNYGNDTATQGVATAQLNVGDQVILGKGFVSPSITVLDDSGRPVTTIDQLKVDPLAGLGTVIGLNDSQALVVMPNQQIATVDRANLSTTQNNTLSQGSKIPVNQQILSGINIPVSTIQNDFGLTQADLLKSVVPPKLTASQLPVLVPIINPSGAQQFINTKQQNVGVGTVISVDPTAGTALIGTSTGIPQVINLQGSSVSTGTNVLFDPSTGTVLGTPVVPTLTTQTQTGVQTYTPIGTPVTTQDKGPSIPTPTNITTIAPEGPPPINVEVPEPVKTENPLTSIVPEGEFVFTPFEQNVIRSIFGFPELPVTTPLSTTTTTKPTTIKPSVPSAPFFPLLPVSEQKPTEYIDYGYPDVPPPEIGGFFYIPPPEYTRSYGPIADVGIMSGATK